MHHPQSNTSWNAILAVILAIGCGYVIGLSVVEAKSMNGQITDSCAPIFTGERLTK